MTESWREVVLIGTWSYGETVPMLVRVVHQNFDPNYEEGVDEDPPTLSESGESYTVAFGELRERWWFQTERETQATEEAAVALAEHLVGQITWRRVDPPERLRASVD